MKKLIACLAITAGLGTSALATPALAAGTPAPRALNASQARNAAIIKSVWPAATENWAVRIAIRESGLRSNAISRTGDYGLMQINWRAHRGWLRKYGITSPRQLLDPAVNARMALLLYRKAGSNPWRATR
ncbi:MAG TPA: transglycosylase SLT domain-containing protein [Acidimicrobiales bacterium]